LLSRDSDTIKILLNGKEEEYRILKMYEFTSDRKMMSIIVKRVNDGKYFVFTKGADDKLSPLSRDSKVA
jgi:magnesium-transporting ATPase (P-type)